MLEEKTAHQLHGTGSQHTHRQSWSAGLDKGQGTPVEGDPNLVLWERASRGREGSHRQRETVLGHEEACTKHSSNSRRKWRSNLKVSTRREHLATEDTQMVTHAGRSCTQQDVRELQLEQRSPLPAVRPAPCTPHASWPGIGAWQQLAFPGTEEESGSTTQHRAWPPTHLSAGLRQAQSSCPTHQPQDVHSRRVGELWSIHR